jgi:thiamine kinase-like enzyme
MLEREDFYSILEKTLSKQSARWGISSNDTGTEAEKKQTVLYVNPQLNAIMSSRVGRRVRNFLKTEYNVDGGLFKRAAVGTYLWVATSFVRLFSQKKILFFYDRDPKELLIYPCNKKIRLFDFGQEVVYTVLKDGFSDLYINREIAFRRTWANEFIPSIRESGNGYYSERIIDGRPLARINDTLFVESAKKKAHEMILSLTGQKEAIRAAEYLDNLADECNKLLSLKREYRDGDIVHEIFERLKRKCPDIRFPLVVSHGDLQPGNIWIENENNRLIIIDWETVNQRSVFYDFVVLYLDIRKNISIQQLYERVLKGARMQGYDYPDKAVAIIVLAEELVYRTEEFVGLPETIGTKEYKDIIDQYTHLNL